VILVVGASGQLGGLIARTLLDRGEPVRALIHRTEVPGLVARGAETVVGDLKDVDSLLRACSGVDAIVTTANAVARGGADTIDSVDRVGNRNLIEAASRAGVRRFVFTSSLGAGEDSRIPLLQAKGETERHLRESDLTWTILQPNLYMDTSVPAVVGGPALSGRAVTLVGGGRRRHSLVAMRDVAAYAVAVLDDARAEGQTLCIGGSEPLSWHDVVGAFAQELGREVTVVSVRLGAPVPGLPGFVSDLLTALDTYDSPLDMTILSRTYGVPPTGIVDFVHDLLAASTGAAPLART
jgi:uncharacterized protein YbjT (DUF2867 family)